MVHTSLQNLTFLRLDASSEYPKHMFKWMGKKKVSLSEPISELGDNCIQNFNLGRYISSDIRSEI